MTTATAVGAARTNWAGNITYSTRDLLRPTSLAGVRRAVTSNPRVTALGSRHSFNRIADSDGAQLSLAEMPFEVEIDSSARVARVSAGATHAAVARELDRQGWALANLASLPHISVAGADATGTHGSGVGNASLAQSVVGVEIVRESGDVEEVLADDPTLDAHRVAIGALGVVTAVHLAIEPRFQIAQRVWTGLGWDVVDDRFEEIMASGYSVSMFTDYGPTGIAQVWRTRRVDRDEPTIDLEAMGASQGTSPLHPVPGAVPDAVTEQLGRPGPWHERLPHFRSDFTPSAGEEIQCEYLLDAADAVPAIHALRSIADVLAPVLFVSEIRRIARDTAWLAPSSGRDSVALHFTFRRNQSGVAAALGPIDEVLAPFGARPHWGKVTAMPAARLDDVFPDLDRFRSLALSLDPAGRFRNAFLRSVIDGDRDR
jgi:alditol oxidase